MPTSAEIQTMITDLLAQQQNVAMGQAVAEVWRDGRRMKIQVVTMAEFTKYLRELQSMLITAQQAEGITPTRRRRAIRLGWSN